MEQILKHQQKNSWMQSSSKLVIIKYNAGNIQSVLYALERLGRQARVTDDHDEIKKADKVIFPGVGEASSAMKYLRERELDQLIPKLKQPVLGICLGMQLMCRHSDENNTECLGIFDTDVKRFQFPDGHLKVPQIGWNQINALKGPLFDGIYENSYCYFVHSFYAGTCNQTVAQTNYGIEFSSALSEHNFFGVQFHPEKSADAGQRVLENFLKI
jgi:imidazole glycerol-phosphate synthase subunit HisH